MYQNLKTVALYILKRASAWSFMSPMSFVGIFNEEIRDYISQGSSEKWKQ